jgi:hypothetical protein
MTQVDELFGLPDVPDDVELAILVLPKFLPSEGFLDQ